MRRTFDFGVATAFVAAALAVQSEGFDGEGLDYEAYLLRKPKTSMHCKGEFEEPSSLP